MTEVWIGYAILTSAESHRLSMTAVMAERPTITKLHP